MNSNPSHAQQPSMHPQSYQNPGGANQPQQAHSSVLQELLLSNNPSASSMNSPRPPYGAGFNTRYVKELESGENQNVGEKFWLIEFSVDQNF